MVIHLVLTLMAALIVYQVQTFNWNGAIQASINDDLGLLGSAGGLQEMQNVDFEMPSDVAPAEWENAAYNSALSSVNSGNGGTTRGSGQGGIGFFGTRSEGKTFAFVVDVSGSMREEFIEPHPNNPGAMRIITRWDKAREELMAAINAMNPEQSYCVALYNNRHIPMYQGGRPVGLKTANDRNRRETEIWLNDVPAVGGTDPRESLAYALEMRPDVLYFLTDGIIPDESREVAALFNRGRTVIHTTCIGYPQSDLLQLIAADHKGQFRAVTPHGDFTRPKGIALVIIARGDQTERQKWNRLESDHERIRKFLDNSGKDFLQPSIHSTLLLNNAISSVSEFEIELMQLLRSLNTKGPAGFSDSIRPGRLGIQIPLDSQRRMTDPNQRAERREEESAVGRLLRENVSEMDFKTFPQNVRKIYLFGDVETKDQLKAAIEIFDLLNGSQIELIDGEKYLRENR